MWMWKLGFISHNNHPWDTVHNCTKYIDSSRFFSAEWRWSHWVKRWIKNTRGNWLSLILTTGLQWHFKPGQHSVKRALNIEPRCSVELSPESPPVSAYTYCKSPLKPVSLSLCCPLRQGAGHVSTLLIPVHQPVGVGYPHATLLHHRGGQEHRPRTRTGPRTLHGTGEGGDGGK